MSTGAEPGPTEAEQEAAGARRRTEGEKAVGRQGETGKQGSEVQRMGQEK